MTTKTYDKFDVDKLPDLNESKAFSVDDLPDLKKKVGGDVVGKESSPLQSQFGDVNQIKAFLTGKSVQEIEADKRRNMKIPTKRVMTQVKKVNDYKDESITDAAEKKINQLSDEDIADPILGVNKLSQANPTNPKDILATQKANEILVNRIAPDGYDAKQMLNLTHFGADENNQTSQILKQKADDYDKSVAPLRNIQVGDLQEATPEYLDNATTPQLKNAAIQYGAQKDPEFAKELQVMGIDLNDPDLAGKVGSFKSGQWMQRFLRDENVGTFLNKENPNLKPAIARAYNNIKVDNPEFGINAVADEVSKEVQKSGFNNIDPIVNFYGQNHREFADQVAQQLYKDDPQSLAIWNQHIKDHQEDYMDAPSLLQGFAESGKNFGKGLVKTFTEPFKPVSETIKESWDKEAKNVNADPKGIFKIIRDTGGAMGTVAPIIATGNVLGGSALATDIAIGAGFGGDALEQGKLKFPDSPVKAWTSALLNTAMYVAMGKTIFPSKNVSSALSKVQPELDQVVENLTSGAITKEAARREVQSLTKQALDFAGGTLTKNAKLTAELQGISIVDKYLDKIMGMDESGMKKYHDPSQDAESLSHIFLSNLVINGLSKYGEMKRGNKMVEESLWNAVTNPKQTERGIDMASIDKSFGTVEEIKDNFRFLQGVKSEMDALHIAPKDQKRFLFESLREKVAKGDLETTEDSTLRKRNEEVVAEAQDVKEKIISGEPLSEEQKPPPTEEEKAQDILGKAKLDDVNRSMADADPVGMLKYIAQQAQNLNEQFEPHGDGKEAASLKRAQDSFGEDTVKEAIALYPKKESQAAITTEGAAENVVPSTFDLRQKYLDDFNIVEDSSFDWRVTSELSAADRKKAVQDIKDGKDTAAARKLENEIKATQERGTVIINRGRGNQAQSVEIPINEWFGLDQKEQNKIFEDADKLDENTVRMINESDITLQNIDDLKHLFNGFPYEQSDFTAIKDYLARQGERSTQTAEIGQSGQTKETVNETQEAPKFSEQTETTSEPTEGTNTPIPPTEEGKGAEPPPAEPVVEEGTGGGKNKSLANRLVNAKNVPEAAKEGIKSQGLTYEPKSQQEAQDLADAILDETGIDDAVLRARAQEFGGDVNTLVQTQALNRLAEMSDKETDPTKKLEHDKKFAEVGVQLDEWLRKQGRGISALNFFYKKSPLGMQMVENTRRKQDFEEWSKPNDKPWKEFFDEMMKEPEFESLVKAEVKKERAEERKERKEKIHKDIDDAAARWAKKVKPKSDTGGAQKQGIGTDEIFKAVASTMKAAYDAGEAVVKVVQDAIDYISDKLGHSEWDTEGFRKEWEAKLKDKTVRKKLTDEEVKAKVIDRFKNKLKGLTDKQKEDVVRKSFQKIVENGGLDYQEFRDIIADITGRGEMTAEEATKLKELVKTLNSVEDAATEARDKRTPEALKKFKDQQLLAGKASKDLNKLLYNKPNIIKRLTSIMQLNTLGIPALVNNPIYNIWNQTTLRFPIGVVNTLVDGTISAIAKTMGKKYTSETNIVYTQKEFFKKLGLGTKEAVQQFATGLDRQDYTQKELHGQQIRPLSSAKDLFQWIRGKKPLTKSQVIDKALQASPQGWIAETIARVLNLGDKPQRFAAEGSQAAAFAKALGIKDIDYRLFVEFPREEAYRKYKADGLSDAEAGKKADYVRDTILKEGQRSTFQQDNMLNDVLNKVFGGESSGVGSLAKAVAVSPYIKIPANAYWSYYNLVNPEVAILQSAIYGAKAISKRNKGDNSAAKDLHEARYWFAHAAVGMATRAVVTSLVLAGVYRSSNSEDDTKKEREGEANYEQQGSINVTKLFALLRGEDPSKIKGGLVMSNRWAGHWGSVGNTIAKRYESMTPEQKKNQDDYYNMVLGNLELSSLNELEQGVFANTSSLLTSLQNPEYGMKRYGLNTINMFTNIVQPAALAQLSKAEVPYVSQTKADTFGQELKNSMLQRSSVLRKISGQMPPAKVGIWGDKIERKDDIPMRLFGFSNVNKDAFARPLYDDVVRTNDIGFFPPSVKPEINGQKLNVEQSRKLEEYIGQARKSYVAPYVNDQAVIDGFDVKYSQLNDKDKKYLLQYLYELGKKDGEARFAEQFPAFEKKETETDYESEQQKEVFKLLQKYK